jgi:hypothetical protein
MQTGILLGHQLYNISEQVCEYQDYIECPPYSMACNQYYILSCYMGYYLSGNDCLSMLLTVECPYINYCSVYASDCSCQVCADRKGVNCVTPYSVYTDGVKKIDNSLYYCLKYYIPSNAAPKCKAAPNANFQNFSICEPNIYSLWGQCVYTSNKYYSDANCGYGFTSGCVYCNDGYYISNNQCALSTKSLFASVNKNNDVIGCIATYKLMQDASGITDCILSSVKCQAYDTTSICSACPLGYQLDLSFICSKNVMQLACQQLIV